MRTPLSRQLVSMILLATLPACWTHEATNSRSQANDGGSGGKGLPNPKPGAIVPTTAPISIQATTSVTDSGHAQMAIPLVVPDGPGGVRPDLTIAVSAGGNGRLGVGASISAGSTIAPCRKTRATDGYADGVDFDRADAYCLDGQRLRELGAADGSSVVFHTEAESFTRIVGQYASPSAKQPMSFVVHARSGLVSHYEPLPATRWKGNGEKLAPVPDGSAGADVVVPLYRVSKVLDASGNEMRYVYEDDDGAVPGDVSSRLHRIDWSFTNNENPRRSVVFHYQPRPDVIVGYQFGVRSRMTTRLAAIEMIAPHPAIPKQVWTYHLSYIESDDSGRSLLHQIERCAADGVCSFKKTFLWTEPNGGWSDHEISDSVEFTPGALSQDQASYQALGGSAANNFYKPNEVGITLLDVDADGKDDILYRTDATRFRPRVVDLAGPYHTFRFDYDPGAIYLRTSDLDILDVRENITAQLEPPPPPPLAPSQVDSDGNLVPSDGLGPWFQAHLAKSRVADLDFDGKVDLLAARTRVESGFWQTPQDALAAIDDPDDSSIPFPMWNFGKWFYGYTTFHGGDWDGTDEMAIEEQALAGPVFRDNADPNGSPYVIRLYTPPFQEILVDLDGDGRVDRVGPALDESVTDQLTTEGWADPAANPPEMQYFAERATGDDHLFSHAWDCGNGAARVADTDGDGRGEVLVADYTDVTLNSAFNMLGDYERLSLHDNGAVALEEDANLFSGDCTEQRPDLVLADLNGDGLGDALYPPGSFHDNELPVVRWNLGNGYGPIEDMPVVGGDELTELMGQHVPTGKWDGHPVAWDRGTRLADLNDDGRTDLVAFRVVASGCADDDLYAMCSQRDTKVIGYLSMGDHFVARDLGTWSGSGVNLAHGFTTAQVGDVTGDGAVDLVHVVDGRIHVVEMKWRMQGDLPKTLYDTGVAHPIATYEYERTGGGGQMGCAYPLGCNLHDTTMVKTHKTFVGSRLDGSAMWREQRHFFAHRRFDLTGRGALGHGLHRIWDRQVGSETIIKYLDHDASVGTFHPFVGRPTSIVEITPIQARPTPAELAASGLTPGLDPSGAIPVRVDETTFEYEVRACQGSLYDPDAPGPWQGCPAGGDVDAAALLLTLPLSTTTTTRETVAYLPTPANPTYNVIDSDPLLVRTVEREHDAYGNATFVLDMTDGGDVRKTTTVYENRVGPWQLGLPALTSTVIAPHQPIAGAALDPGARRVERTFDDAGRVETITLSAETGAMCAVGMPCDNLDEGATTVLGRDDGGRITTVTTTAPDVAAPRVLTFTHDYEGIRWNTVTNGAGEQHAVVYYPGFDVPVYTIDENGVVGEATYDGFGRLRSSTRPGAVGEQVTYSPFSDGNRRGMITSVDQSDGGKRITITDELARSVEEWTLGFAWTEWIAYTRGYDAVGDLVRTSRPGFGAPANEARTVERDRLGRVTAVVEPDGTTTELEHTLFDTLETDPMGHVRYVHRDHDGRVVETGHLVDDGNQVEEVGEVEHTYGAFGELVQTVVAGGPTSEYHHDPLGRLVYTSDPDRGAQELTYNGFNELVTTSGAEKSEEVGYDDVGRLIWSKGADGTTIYEWGTTPGAINRLVSVKSPDAVVTEHEYDGLGAKIATRQSIDGGVPDELVFTRDDLGRVRTITYPQPASGIPLVARYDYNSHGYLASIRDVSECPDPLLAGCGDELWKVTSRNADLALARATYAAGAIHAERAHDTTTGEIVGLEVPEASVKRTYAYDDDGRLLGRTDSSTLQSEWFTYDDLHRLAEWAVTLPAAGGGIPIKTTKYGYDELGNLEWATEDGDPVWAATYGADGKPHALATLTIDGVLDDSFGYDKEGRQLAGNGRKVTYGQYDLPRTVTTEKAEAVYLYDGLGDRVRKQREGVETIYLADLYERRTDEQGITDVCYVRNDEGVVAQLQRSPKGGLERLFLIADPLNSTSVVMELVQGQPKVVETARFDPWGTRVDDQVEPTADPDLRTRLGFTGHEHDDDDALINMNGRIYDPAQRRFLTTDPFVADPLSGQSYNRYAYTRNDPLNRVDPSGYDDEWVQVGDHWEKQVVEDDGTSYTIVSYTCPDAVCGSSKAETPSGGGASGGASKSTDEGAVYEGKQYTDSAPTSSQQSSMLALPTPTAPAATPAVTPPAPPAAPPAPPAVIAPFVRAPPSQAQLDRDDTDEPRLVAAPGSKPYYEAGRFSTMGGVSIFEIASTLVHPTSPSGYVVSVHGNPLTVNISGAGGHVGADKAAAWITSTPGYLAPGKPAYLVLRSCNTAVGGRSSIAAGIAVRLGIPVYAPVGFVTGAGILFGASCTGSTCKSDSNAATYWVKFFPDGSFRTAPGGPPS